MEYAILNWIDGSLEKYATEQEAVLEYHRQIASHKKFKAERNAEAEFDKMIIKILYKYNDIDKS